MGARRVVKPIRNPQTQVIFSDDSSDPSSDEQPSSSSTAARQRSPSLSAVSVIKTSLEDLQGLQVVLYKDNKAIGRLLAPVVLNSASEAKVEFQSFQVAADRTASKEQLCILVDDSFSAARWQLKFFSSRGSCLSEYVFSGGDCGAAIEQHRQKTEYIVAQHRKFLAEGGAHRSSAVTLKQELFEIERGDCFARSSLGFDVSKAIPSLERVSFTLAVVDQTALHEVAISEHSSIGSRIFAIAEENEPRHLERRRLQNSKALDDMSSFAEKHGAAAVVAVSSIAQGRPDSEARLEHHAPSSAVLSGEIGGSERSSAQGKNCDASSVSSDAKWRGRRHRQSGSSSGQGPPASTSPKSTGISDEAMAAQLPAAGASSSFSSPSTGKAAKGSSLPSHQHSKHEPQPKLLSPQNGKYHAPQNGKPKNGFSLSPTQNQEHALANGNALTAPRSLRNNPVVPAPAHTPALVSRKAASAVAGSVSPLTQPASRVAESSASGRGKPKGSAVASCRQAVGAPPPLSSSSCWSRPSLSTKGIKKSASSDMLLHAPEVQSVKRSSGTGSETSGSSSRLLPGRTCADVVASPARPPMSARRAIAEVNALPTGPPEASSVAAHAAASAAIQQLLLASSSVVSEELPSTKGTADRNVVEAPVARLGPVALLAPVARVGPVQPPRMVTSYAQPLPEAAAAAVVGAPSPIRVTLVGGGSHQRSRSRSSSGPSPRHQSNGRQGGSVGHNGGGNGYFSRGAGGGSERPPSRGNGGSERPPSRGNGGSERPLSRSGSPAHPDGFNGVRGGSVAGRPSGLRGSSCTLSLAIGSLQPPLSTSSTDLERFLFQVAPTITLSKDRDLNDIILEDVWRFYLEPSLYGREVYALGGQRGPSLCYFVPYLSAIQLFTLAAPPKDELGNSNRVHLCDVDGWPKHMHLQFEHFEQDLPFNRMPLSDQIDGLSKQPQQPDTLCSGESEKIVAAPTARPIKSGSPVEAGSPWPLPEPGLAPHSSGATSDEDDSLANVLIGPALGSRSGSCHILDQDMPSSSSAPPKHKLQSSFLTDSHVSSLHPASWYAVAWYPVYRIPDAPLCARFLTYHSFAPLLAAIQTPPELHGLGVQKDAEDCAVPPVPEMEQNQDDKTSRGANSAVAASRELPMPVVGLKWNNMHGERWLDPITEEEARKQQQQQYTLSKEVSGNAGGRRMPCAAIDIAWQAHLGELQGTAECLSRGHGVRVIGPLGIEEDKKARRHPDFEFFHSRS